MTSGEARARFSSARVAVLGTLGPDGPRLVPVCFAVADGGKVIWTAVDHKPKRTTALARLRDIASDPRVSLVAHAYDDADWSRLWWARASGTASVHESHPDAVAALRERYAQYGERPPAGPVIEVAVTRWSGWSAAE